MRNSTAHTAPQGANDPSRTVSAISSFSKTFGILDANGHQHILPLDKTRLQGYILPGRNPGRNLRRSWQAESSRIILVADDDRKLGGCHGPSGFDATTLRWAVYNSVCVVLWECGVNSEVLRRLSGILATGSSVLIITTNVGHRDAWRRLIVSSMRQGTKLEFYLAEG